MPIDDLAEGAVRVLGRLLVELLAEVVFELLPRAARAIGRTVLRTLSLGAWPPSPPTARQDVSCTVAGLAVLIAGVAFAVWRLTL